MKMLKLIAIAPLVLLSTSTFAQGRQNREGARGGSSDRGYASSNSSRYRPEPRTSTGRRGGYGNYGSPYDNSRSRYGGSRYSYSRPYVSYPRPRLGGYGSVYNDYAYDDYYGYDDYGYSDYGGYYPPVAYRSYPSYRPYVSYRSPGLVVGLNFGRTSHRGRRR